MINIKKTLKKSILELIRIPDKSYQKFKLFEKVKKPFENLDLRSLPTEISKSFYHYNSLPQIEYLYQVTGNKLFIEPSCGFVFSSFGLIEKSIPYSYDAFLSFPSLIKRFIFPKKVKWVYLDNIISLRDIYDINYFHFFNDLLPRLLMIEKHLAKGNQAVVVSKRLSQEKFFQEVYTKGIFGTRKIIIQDENTFIKAKEIIFCKVLPHSKNYMDGILDRLKVATQPQGNEKIFVTRDQKTRNGRFLKNLRDIQKICHELNFKIIDPGSLTLNQQIEIFSKADFVVGIHGGGLTNIVFRRESQLKVLEILPPDNIPPHYFWLSKIFGFDYNAVLGFKSPDLNKMDPFEVDPNQVKSAIKSMLQE